MKAIITGLLLTVGFCLMMSDGVCFPYANLIGLCILGLIATVFWPEIHDDNKIDILKR